MSVFVNPASNDVYVADYGNSAIKVIPGGTGTPVAIGSGFNNPFSVFVNTVGCTAYNMQPSPAPSVSPSTAPSTSPIASPSPSPTPCPYGLWTTFQDMDCNQGDVPGGHISAASLADCQAACLNVAGCSVVMWAGYNDCYLKYSTGWTYKYVIGAFCSVQMALIPPAQRAQLPAISWCTASASSSPSPAFPPVSATATAPPSATPPRPPSSAAPTTTPQGPVRAPIVQFLFESFPSSPNHGSLGTGAPSGTFSNGAQRVPGPHGGLPYAASGAASSSAIFEIPNVAAWWPSSSLSFFARFAYAAPASWSSDGQTHYLEIASITVSFYLQVVVAPGFVGFFIAFCSLPNTWTLPNTCSQTHVAHISLSYPTLLDGAWHSLLLVVDAPVANGIFSACMYADSSALSSCTTSTGAFITPAGVLSIANDVYLYPFIASFSTPHFWGGSQLAAPLPVEGPWIVFSLLKAP